MENCIFCKIVDGKIPSHNVYEDSEFLAFLSIDPVSPGHTLVIPKKHYRWVWDVPNAGAYFEAARKVALAQKKAFGTDFVLSKIVGEEVPHAHIWIYPDKEIAGDKKDFAGNAEKIKKYI
jgi:histidine triad (HIT) family protein